MSITISIYCVLCSCWWISKAYCSPFTSVVITSILCLYTVEFHFDDEKAFDSVQSTDRHDMQHVELYLIQLCYTCN